MDTLTHLTIRLFCVTQILRTMPASAQPCMAMTGTLPLLPLPLAQPLIPLAPQGVETLLCCSKRS